MKIQLQCGHTMQIQGLPTEDYYICDNSRCRGKEVKLYAVETREWKFKCYECRYARWTGQSASSSRLVGDEHHRKTGHQGSCDYLSHPAKKDEVRLVWGRAVKLVILQGQPPALRNAPKWRTPVNKPAATENPLF